MLADPNDESPANVDAAKEWRELPDTFKKKVVRCVRRSQEELWSNRTYLENNFVYKSQTAPELLDHNREMSRINAGADIYTL